MTTFRSICCSLGSVVEGIEQKAEGREVEGRRHSPQATSESMDDMKQVLRCPECEARVALERDLISINELSDSVSVGQFEGVANVRREGDFASCARCGNRLFALELVEDDSQLVLEYDGQSVFQKSPLRILTITKASLGYFYSFHREFFGEGKDMQYRSEHTLNTEKFGWRAIEEIFSLRRMEEERGTRVDQRNVLWLKSGGKGAGARCEKLMEAISSMPHLADEVSAWHSSYDFDTFQAEVFSAETYDFVLIAQLIKNMPLSWTGIRSRDMEEILVSSWVASGGNILFGQWGLPFHTTKHGLDVDLERIIHGTTCEEIWSTNRQDVFARLIEEGNYLVYWPESDGLPDYARDRISRALAYPIHTKWMFRNDLHEGAFDTTTGTFFPRKGRSNDILDKFLPKTSNSRGDTLSHEGRGNGTYPDIDLSSLVRKSSRGLLDAGSKILNALEDGWTKIVERIGAA